MADGRRRPRRIQKKIDKRFGLLHCDRRTIYLRMVSHAMKPMFATLVAQNLHIADLNREIMGIVREATARAKETADA